MGSGSLLVRKVLAFPSCLSKLASILRRAILIKSISVNKCLNEREELDRCTPYELVLAIQPKSVCTRNRLLPGA